MLYSKNQENKLSHELFQNPTKEYRGAPFWSWNTKMTEKHIEDTLAELKEMGMGGAHLHPRTGMNLPYLGDEFMNMVKQSHETANKLDMLTWLYDEDRWPSGAAGGLVTREEKYRMRFLVLSPVELPENENTDEVTLEASAKAVRGSKRKFLSRYAVWLNDGYLKDYFCVDRNDKLGTGYEEWFAYLEISGNSAWFNNQAYLNTLDKKAVERFIEVTHEAYYREVGEAFGDTIPAIFTDEPQFSAKTMLGFAEDRSIVTLPYTDDFDDTYYNTYGEHFLNFLPEVIWDLPDNEISHHRYQYHDHVCERFTGAFADTAGKWCREHNLLLVGHMMQEPTLYSQTSALGEAMRSYRSFGIPGIDMLCDRRELTTAKQAQSAAHQYDCPGVLSELYGVTNWDFDFRGHKAAGDWQAALGVTVRVHHLTWTSMAGEAKRDYPAPIGYQSPWYKEYAFIENYFARLNTALTRGKAEVKVGIIHPIESYWLYWGTKEHTEDIRKEMDDNFSHLVEWMLYGLIDFDFISEALLPELQSMEEVASSDFGFKAGAMNYDVIVVPNCITLRSTTIRRLTEFVSRGGKVIFTGNTPRYIDGVKSPECTELIRQCTCIDFTKHTLLSALSSYRIIDVRNEEGKRADNLLYQIRMDGAGKWLFICHSEKPLNRDIPKKEDLFIQMKGCWRPVKYNAMDGDITSCGYVYKNGQTIITESVYEQDSLLYYLEPSGSEISKKYPEQVTEINNTTSEKPALKNINYPTELKYSLSEPNVLLLDMAEYRLDDGKWQPQEEILRIDNLFRERLGFPLRTEAFAQPWLDITEEEIGHKLTLRYRIKTDAIVTSPSLALENAEITDIVLHGKAVPSVISGWYTDRDIHTVKLPDLKPGENILEVRIPFASKINVEYMYLLGDFSVSAAGRTAVISEPKRQISFGDICRQGFPFYGGNITYEIPLETEEGELIMEAAQFRCPVIKVTLDGDEKGYIALSPYRLNLGKVAKGQHRIGITAFGNRINTFGTVHNCNHTEHWIGPNAWRSTGTSWAYEYQLEESGILVSPVIYLKK